MRRSADRFLTVAPARPDAEAGWAVTRHSFSFGEHYDPDVVGFGALVALNDETVRAGEGYPEHTHRDVDIVTWVLSGALWHRDTAYADDDSVVTLEPGDVQLLSAGAGVTHAEGASEAGPVRFVQAWVRPDEPGGPAAYVVGGVKTTCLSSAWVLLASGSDEDAILELRSHGTSLWVTRLEARVARELPEAASAYVLVARGTVEVDGPGRLEEGDALTITRPAPLTVTAVEPAEVLVWTFAS